MLQNEWCYKTVHVTKRYVTERYGYKTVTNTRWFVLQTVTVTKRYVLRTDGLVGRLL